jgi:hypothetical protein
MVPLRAISGEIRYSRGEKQTNRHDISFERSLCVASTMEKQVPYLRKKLKDSGGVP